MRRCRARWAGAVTGGQGRHTDQGAKGRPAAHRQAGVGGLPRYVARANCGHQERPRFLSQATGVELNVLPGGERASPGSPMLLFPFLRLQPKGLSHPWGLIHLQPHTHRGLDAPGRQGWEPCRGQAEPLFFTVFSFKRVRTSKRRGLHPWSTGEQSPWPRAAPELLKASPSAPLKVAPAVFLPVTQPTQLEGLGPHHPPALHSPKASPGTRGPHIASPRVHPPHSTAPRRTPAAQGLCSDSCQLRARVPRTAQPLRASAKPIPPSTL